MLRSLISLGLLMTSAPVIMAIPANAEAASCYAVADTPTLSGGNVVYSGRGECPGDVIERIRVSLVMDGSTVARTVNECAGFPSPSCSDFGLHPNRAGNQRWCSRVEVFDTWGNTLATNSRCETQNW